MTTNDSPADDPQKHHPELQPTGLEQGRDPFVFRDSGGKRWTRLRLTLLIAGTLAFLAIVLFAQSLLAPPLLKRPDSLQAMQARLKVLQWQEGQTPASKPAWLKFTKTGPERPKLVKARSGEEIRLGFYAGWDASSLDSLKAHADQLTHLSPAWLTITDGEGTLVSAPDPEIREFARDAGLVFLPRLDNLVRDSWIPENVEGLINGPPERQQRFLDELLTQLEDLEAGGVIVEWNEVDPAYRQQMTALLQLLAEGLHNREMELWLSIPMGTNLRVFELEALAPTVDRFVAMLHDENSEDDRPGPIASQPWYDGWLQTVTAYARPEQWIIGLGAYGYDWEAGKRKAETIRFIDALARAGHAGVQDCASTPPVGNPRFSYEEQGRQHTVWFLDAISFANQLWSARQRQVGGIAIFQLGMEDPGIWEVLALPSGAPTPASLAPLQSLPTEGLVANVGRGEFLSVVPAGADGRREFSSAPQGQINSHYCSFPSYISVFHQGEAAADQVAITFDDGPDAEWTPQILDVLRDKGVKATFFMVGTKMEDHPELVQRMVAEGHEIGVHTYTHPNLAKVSKERALLEFNASQRLIEKITGRSTLLFRPPYKADNLPHSEEEIIPLQLAQKRGYLTVSNSIDPMDWERPGVEQIVQRVKEARSQGQVVLLHDAGGDRQQTVEALPLIIDYLQARGDRIVPLATFIGVAPAALMPAVTAQEPLFNRLVSESGFEVLHHLENFLWAFMIVATGLIVARTLLVVLLALRHQPRSPLEPAFAPALSVVMAAYNEEKVIAKTLAAILRTDYAGALEVLVVDDGSSDTTAQIVAELAAADGRIRLLRQPNLGKARALRRGLAAARHEFLVMLDADTQFQADTLRQLLQPLAQPACGAVSGHARVGNLRSFIARCQSLEYICGFNLDRRAYHQLNCITVVPGAISAFRRSAIVAAGGISTDTLAEDTDLTLSLHRAGYRIAYVPEAVAWTEAPETFAALARQRFRWAYGTMQCLWKHRDLLLASEHKALGFFSLPSIWFFQIVLVAIVPLVDGLLLFSLLFGVDGSVFLYCLAFLCSDLLLALLACRLEGEKALTAWRIVPMRFIYRPLLAWVIWKSLFKACKGVWVGWGKLERTASVSLPADRLRS